MLTVPHVSLGNLEIAGPGYVQHRNIDLNDGELVFNTLRLKYRNNSLWDIRDAKPLEIYAPELLNIRCFRAPSGALLWNAMLK